MAYKLTAERYSDGDEGDPREDGTAYTVTDRAGHLVKLYAPDVLATPGIIEHVRVGDEVMDLDKLPWAGALLLTLWADPRVQAEVARQLTRQGDPVYLRTPAPALQPPAVPLAPVHLIPEPEGFDDKIAIGTIAGEAVYGLLMWDEQAGAGRPYGVEATLGGLKVCFYPDPGGRASHDVIDFGGKGVHCTGEIRLCDFGVLLELHQSGQLPELIALGRRWCARREPLPFEPQPQRRAA